MTTSGRSTPLGAPVLSLRGVHIGPADADSPDLVSGVDLDVHRGEFVGLVGESGSGKTLTVKSAAGLLPRGLVVRSGAIRVGGVDVTATDEAGWQVVRRDSIGVITQNPSTSLNPRLTVYAQVSEALPAGAGRRRADRAQRVVQLLSDAGITDPQRRLRQYPYELSGGVAQRVAIAIALAREPAVLIADEPTTALDVTTQARIMDLLEQLRAQRALAVVLVSHDLDLINDHCDVVNVMRDGVIVESGVAADIASAAEHPYTRTLQASTPTALLGSADTVFTRPPVVVGDRPPTVRVDGLVKSFDEVSPRRRWRTATARARSAATPTATTSRRAVDDVSFSIAPGEILGIVGESGAGKTTVARIIAGLARADAGAVHFGADARPQRRGGRPGGSEHVGFVFQDNYAAFDPRLSIGASIGDALWRRRRELGRERIAELVAAGLRDVGLADELASRLPQQLSGGQRQRAGIARALITEPSLIIADEPVSALDVTVQTTILELIVRLNRERGTSFLIVSHDIGVIRLIADTTLVMSAGRVVEAGPTETVTTDPRHPYTAQLLAAIPGNGVRRRAAFAQVSA